MVHARSWNLDLWYQGVVCCCWQSCVCSWPFFRQKGKNYQTILGQKGSGSLWRIQENNQKPFSRWNYWHSPSKSRFHTNPSRTFRLVGIVNWKSPWRKSLDRTVTFSDPGFVCLVAEKWMSVLDHAWDRCHDAECVTAVNSRLRGQKTGSI